MIQKKIIDAVLSIVKEKYDFYEGILSNVKDQKNHLIEIVGKTGTGKSYVLDIFKNLLTDLEKPHVTYFPKIYKYNQFEDIIKLISNITDSQFNDLLEESTKFSPSSRYDVFYFITEKLSKAELFKPTTILIYNCDFLDQYTIDFIQYIVEYSTEVNINFITFSNRLTFDFSTKYYLEYLSVEDIVKINKDIYNTEDENNKIAELLFEICSGNIALIEAVIYDLKDKKIIKASDLSSFFKKGFQIKNMLTFYIEKLPKEQQDLLYTIYLLDGRTTKAYLKEFYPDSSYENNLEDLLDRGYFYEFDNIIFIRHLTIFRSYFEELHPERTLKLTQQIHDYLSRKNEEEQILVSYLVALDKYDQDKFYTTITSFEVLKSYKTIKKLVKYILNKTLSKEVELEMTIKLGKTNRKLKHMEEAADNFRRALQLSSETNYSPEEIVYYLAKSLHNLNSISFAEEIIRKFSPKKIDQYWKSKLLILKAELQKDLENHELAFNYIDKAQEASNLIEDENKRILMLAECKKISGRIYYEDNQWDKSELEFKNAEGYYKRINNLKGIAAIFNNIGVLAIFKSEWGKAEEFYKKSLELEKQRYSLNGISVCYNNIGYLIEDKGDYKESLRYLEEALKIQKLLNNRYNITMIYINMGVTYMDNGEYEKSAKTLKMALETAVQFGLYKTVIAALNNLGSLYKQSGDLQKSLEYYEQAIEKSKENNFLEGLLRSYNNLGDLYRQKDEYNMAYELFFKGYEIMKDVSDDFLKAEVKGNLGSVLTLMHKFSEAYPHLVESHDYFKGLDAKDKMVEGLLNFSFYFLKTRNYDSSLYYINKTIDLAKEIHKKESIGKAFLIRASLEHKNLDDKQKYQEKAIEIFIETKHDYELAMANYDYASTLYEKGDWEQALEILKDNKKLIKQFGSISINLLEKNDTLIQRISKDFKVELKEAKNQESLLNKFYEITHNLNLISNFDLLLETALDNLVDLAEADGAILCLYNSRSHPESWEYKIFNNFNLDNEDYDILMDTIQETITKNESFNYKQPHFAPHYNNVITFPLTIRNNPIGVILLFAKHGSHYFTQKMYNLINALSNQIVVIIENNRHTNLERSHAIIREELSTSNPFSNIIGKSSKMQEIFGVIDKIKDTPTTVLLEGPSGTGKELIARAIHYTSNRSSKKFVAQYCGALPETLLESELFGHVKGAFTGAAYDKKGLFEIADGGTFFLDEIADISLSTQAKILRFLQEGEIKRVGSTKTQHVNVRVICATNVSLQEKVKKGEFRLDLYYRLNVIKIDVPALKSRKSDIPLLAIHFLDKYNKKLQKEVKGITDEAMKYLIKCDWPGNIRQLENEIERSVTLTDNDSFIRPSDLSEEVFRYTENTETIELLEKQSLKAAVERLEKSMILKALKKHNWNQTQAANDLGLSRQGLIKKIKRYQIEK